jgi:hypothetical protein
MTSSGPEWAVAAAPMWKDSAEGDDGARQYTRC